MSGRGSSSTRGAAAPAAARGFGREARALQGWLMKPTARRRSLSSASSMSPTGVPSMQATASSPTGRGAQTTRSGARGRGLGRGRGTRARGRGRGRGGRSGRGSFATTGETTPAVRGRGSRGRGRPRGRAGRASSREPVGARSQQESETVVKTEAGGSGQGAGIRPTAGGEAAVPEDASSEEVSSSSSLEEFGTKAGEISSPEGSPAGRRVVGRISEESEGRGGAAAAAVASDEVSSSGDDGMDVDDDDDDDDEEEDDDDSEEDNDDEGDNDGEEVNDGEGDKESEEEEEEEDERSSAMIGWTSAQDDDSDEGKETDDAREKAAGGRDEAIEEGLDKKVLSAIINKIRQGREGDHLYKGLGKGWRKYCTAAKAAVRKKAEEPPRRPRRGRPPGSIGKKRKLLLQQQQEQHQEQHQRLQQQQQQQQPSFPSPRTVGGRKLLKLAAKPPSGGGGSGSPATVSSAARAARAARTWTKESRGGAGKQKRVPKAVSPRSRKKPAEEESHEEEDGAEDDARKKVQGDGEGGGKEAETAAKPPGKKLSAGSKERVAYRPRRAGGTASKSTTTQGKFSPSSGSRVTLASVVTAASAAAAPAAYASWTKKTGDTISRHPIVPGRTIPEDGRPTTTAAVVPAALPASSRDGGVGNGGSSSGGGGGGGGSSSIASSVGSSVSVVPDGRGKPTLRPSLVLARNPNRSGYQWPARVCDKDEVEESFSHSDLDPMTHEHKVLVVFLCEGGHHYFAWVPEGDVSLMPAGDIGLGKFGELWPVDFTAAVMWARQLSRVQIDEEQKKLFEAKGDLRRQEAPPYKKPRQASPRSTPAAPALPSQAGASTAGLPLPKGFSRDIKGKVGGEVAKEKGGAKRGGKWARKPGRQPSPTTNVRPGWKPVVEGERGSVRLRQGSVRCHPINAAAHSFFTDELECPWRCKDCGRFTRSCGCGKGLVEYVRRQGERSSHRFEKFACRNPSCICCKPPGLPLFMAEWALAPARFKLRDGERPPAEAKPRRVSAPPRWEREAISQGRASARGGSSDPDDTSPTDDVTTAEGTAISGGSRSVVSINRANPQYFQRRLGANERCNKCEGCMRPNCGKCWACSHRIEFGGAGNKNQPCTERWCRTKAAQRHADKAERAARRKTLATGGGVSAKRTLDSSGEEYESDDGELSTVDGAGKRFRRSRRAGGGGSTAGASGGGGSGGRQSPVVGPGGDLNLSFVFIGDGHAGAGAGWGGNKGPQGCAEAVHVSTESAGVVTKVVNNTSTSQTARPSSISKNSRLKDLLTKGYRCLALLEEIGPQPLLKASARVIAAGSMLGSGFAIEVSGDETMGKGIRLTWLGGELKLESAVRKRLAQFNPFHDVPEIETSTSIEPPPPAPLPEPDSQEAAQHVLRRQAQSQSNVDVYVEDSKNKLAASLPAAATTAITVAGALSPLTSTAPALSTPSSAAADGGADNGGDVVGTMSSTRTPRPDALKEAGSGSSGDASGGASAAVTSAICPPDDAKGSSSDQAATHAKAVLGSGLAEASNVSKAEGVSERMHGGAGKAEVDGGAGNNDAVESTKGVGSETGGKACTVGQGAGGRGASGDVGAAAKAAKVDEAEEEERDAERGDGVVTSKYLGVTKQHGRWVARITRPLSGVKSYLGAFDDDVQAAKQYDKYAKMWLENPDVNFPRGTANSRSRGVAPPPAPTSVSTISTTSSASTISSLPRSASCTTSAVSERSPTVVDSGVSEVAVNSLAKAAKKAIEGEDADIKGKKEQENQASPSPSDPPPSANEPATSKPRGDGDGDVNSSGGNKENPPPPPQIPLQSQHELEEQTKQKLEQAESEDDAEIAGSLLVEYLWGGKGEGKRPGEEDARGNVRGNGTGDGNSEVGIAACGGGVATMETATKTPTQGDGDSGEGSEVREGSGDDTAMMIDSLTSSDDSSATVATSDKGEDVDDEASGADEDGGGGADPEEAGVLLIPAVSRTLRRGYLAQSLARIVGAAGVIRKARRGVERRSGGEVKRENRRGGNDPGLQGAEEALALAKAGGTGEGDSVDSGGGGDGGGEASKLKGGTWGAAQEQSAAAMEALDALDRGIEELFDEDERTLRRYARAVEEDACRGLRKRLRQLENQEARAVVQLSKSRMEQEEQKADLAQLESIAGKAFSDNSIKALQDALAAERQAAAEYEARVAEEQRRLDAIKQDRKTTKASVAKEREAAAAAGQEGFMKDQEAFLKRVKEEWAALRSALRRRLGAARTLLLTDGACRLHAVPSDRLEQPRRMDEAWRALLFLEKVYPNETLLKRCVDPAWVEMVTPETILMLAHSRAYVDQLRTRVDEAGSSVECLTAIDASEDEAVATSTSGGGGGRRDAFQNTYGYGYGDRDINSRGNGARDKAERAMAVFGRDTVGNKRSWEAAMTAAGAVLEAVDRVLHGEAHNAFCAVRPPGHHAGVELHCMGAVSNGFCILNNVALAALYARHYGNVGRIAVVDFDVHHGNGTQDVLCRTEHPGFLYVSIHAFNRGGGDGSHPRIFPGTGAADEAHGNVLNIPLGDQVHPYVFHRATSRVIAALDAFRPNLILISAGFDAHQSDPSQLGTLSARDFEVFTRRLVTAAERLCGGRLVSVLEGGYALECQATVRRTGQARPPSPSPVGGVPARVGKKGRVASGETLADCIQAHCKGLVDGLIGGIDDD